jgi:hypothetical protein
MARKLVSLIGPAHACLMLYTGTRIDADEAQRRATCTVQIVCFLQRPVPGIDLPVQRGIHYPR